MLKAFLISKTFIVLHTKNAEQYQYFFNEIELHDNSRYYIVDPEVKKRGGGI